MAVDFNRGRVLDAPDSPPPRPMAETDSSREWIRFKHARFTARFPADYRYSRSHYWMAPAADEPGLLNATIAGVTPAASTK